MRTEDVYNGCSSCRNGRHDYCRKQLMPPCHSCCCECRAYDRQRRMKTVGAP